MSKHIGIVAVSAEGAALCYQTICGLGARRMGEHDHPEVSLHTTPLVQYMAPIRAGEDQKLGAMLAASAKKLSAAGADFFVCPDNTAHTGLEIARTLTDRPWLHIADEVAKVAAQRGFARLGITGTRFLMESDVYPSSLRPRSIEWEIPAEEQRVRMNDIIFSELVYGKITSDSRRFFLDTIATLKERGCDAVVLGCTEIPLIVLPEESALPTLDSTRILAAAAVQFALDD